MKAIGKFAVNKIHEGNSLNLLKQVPSGTIDHILTDPPFAIDFRAKRNNYNRTAGRVIEGYNEVTKENYLDFSKKWISESHRVLKDNGSMLVFSGWTNLKDILISLEEAGFTTMNHLIWKYQFGVFTKNKFVTSHYHILFVVKDPKSYRFNKMDHYPEDVLTVNREYWTGKAKTPTKLPTKLVRKLLSYLTNEGDLVLDPFMGSGTTAVVCKSMNRRFLGFEIVPAYVKFANDRLSGKTRC
jgi:site-specific DNA-methyltransferase (adenine-specific)